MASITVFDLEHLGMLHGAPLAVANALDDARSIAAAMARMAARGASLRPAA